MAFSPVVAPAHEAMRQTLLLHSLQGDTIMNGFHRTALAGLVLVAAGCTAAPASDTIQAATGPATVTTDRQNYTFATPVRVTFAGLDGAAANWVSLAPQGSPLTTTPRWAFTGGGTTGTLVFEGPSTGGTYVARAFDASSVLQGESDPFTVEDASQTMATVAATQAAYTMQDPITITWTGMPGNVQDWIAIAPVGFPDNDQAEFRLTGGGVAGSVTFTGGFELTGFPPGIYVARAYLNNTFTKVAESVPFTIGAAGGPAISTNLATYPTSEPISVIWAGLPGNQNDWVGITPSGAPATTVSTWVYVAGAVTGRTSFDAANLAPGSYVARAYLDDSYTVLAESAVFTVTAAIPAGVTTDLSTYALGQSITISWTGLTTNATNWVDYAPAGSSDTTVTRWSYTGGLAAGSLLFEGPLAPGMYVARTFANDTYIKTGESAVFAVQ
jgi:hypothetical protein